MADIVYARESSVWEARVRLGFWIVGIAAGGILTYTSRHFINGDAINYIEIGEAFRTARWWDLVNLTASPGYGVLLGIGQSLMDTNRANEIPLLKIVNFVCLIFAMGACELLLSAVKRQRTKLTTSLLTPLPWYLVMAFGYSMFLFSALNWVRPRLMAPEMAVLVLVMLSMVVIVSIRENPKPYGKFVLLGILSGITYFFKTFFFPFSVIFIGCAAVAVGSVRKAAPRALVAVIVMLAVSAPLLTALSVKLGRFSYGESGTLNYAKYVSKRGHSLNRPIVLAEMPEVLLYRNNPFVNSTRPATFDPSYWEDGVKPVFDLSRHLSLFAEHTWQIINNRPWLLFAILLWFIWQMRIGKIEISSRETMALPLLLAVPGIFGIAMYSIIHVEMRYLAPFLFLVFLALILIPKYAMDDRAVRSKAHITTSLLTVIVLGFTLSTVIDQSVRSVRSTNEKPSYSEAYFHLVALKDYLNKKGLRGGEDVAVVGFPPFYWGRLANLKIIAEIPKEEQVISATRDKRKHVIATLSDVGVNTLVAKGKQFGRLTEEGWELVPGTRDFYVLLADRNNDDKVRRSARNAALTVHSSGPSSKSPIR